MSLDCNLSAVVTLVDGDGDVFRDEVGIGQFVSFKDDGPIAASDEATVAAPLSFGINVAWVLDFSGSIDSGELSTMLNAVKAGAEKIFNNSDAGTVNMTIVAFGNDAVKVGDFSDLSSFEAKIAELIAKDALGIRPVDDRATNYTAAIEMTMDSFDPESGDSNQVFFISDGNPNQQTGINNSLQSGTASDWQTFIESGHLNVVTIGVDNTPNGIQTQRLQDVDLDGEGAPIIITQFSSLVDTILDQIPSGTSVSGNVVGNDDFGSDGGRVLSFTVDEGDGQQTTYTWDGVNTITSSEGGSTSGDVITVQTGLGGSFTFHFDSDGTNTAGSWTYVPASTTGEVTEVVTYRIVDGDGTLTNRPWPSRSFRLRWSSGATSPTLP
jgi:uncharacterized protein YegL